MVVTCGWEGVGGQRLRPDLPPPEKFPQHENKKYILLVRNRDNAAKKNYCFIRVIKQAS